MLGAVVSDLVLVGAVALGLGALLAASEFWFSVLKWVGAWHGWAFACCVQKAGLTFLKKQAAQCVAAVRFS